MPNDWIPAMHSRILVYLDSCPASLRGLDEAVRLAVLEGAALRLMHVVDASRLRLGDGVIAVRDADLIPCMEEAAIQMLQQARERAAATGIATQTLLLTVQAARTADVIIEQAWAWNADLIVAGTHGGSRGLGPALRDGSPIPVLLVHAARAEEAGVAPADACVSAIA
jgi:nucleotide-binding universal stress UspA family protein